MDELELAYERAREAWTSFEGFWQNREQATPEAQKALDDLNKALAELADAWSKWYGLQGEPS